MTEIFPGPTLRTNRSLQNWGYWARPSTLVFLCRESEACICTKFPTNTVVCQSDMKEGVTSLFCQTL